MTDNIKNWVDTSFGKRGSYFSLVYIYLLVWFFVLIYWIFWLIPPTDLISVNLAVIFTTMLIIYFFYRGMKLVFLFKDTAKEIFLCGIKIKIVTFTGKIVTGNEIVVSKNSEGAFEKLQIYWGRPNSRYYILKIHGVNYFVLDEIDNIEILINKITAGS